MPEFLDAFPILTEELLGHFKERCVVCRMPAYIVENILDDDKIAEVLCTRCGSYSIPFQTWHHPKWRHLRPIQIANISGYIRENPGLKIQSEQDIDFLSQLSTPAVADKAHKLLAVIARNYPIPGASLQIDCGFIDNQAHMHFANSASSFQSDPNGDRAALRMFPALSASWSQNGAELRFLLIDYLMRGVGFLELMSSSDREPQVRFKVTAKGWDHLQSAGLSNSTTGFVAMWFDDSMNLAWEQAFYPAIKAAGYTPFRIDKKEHNNKIDDEIMASIRGARFIVADFTGQRGGVYFEAGFAHGLGKPVIWTVRSDWLRKLHFDTRQFNHIAWKKSRLNELRDALMLRIEATIGRGPLRD
jgi:hypothetical protein